MFKNTTDKLLTELTAAQTQNDHEQIAKYYLKLGKTYKQNGRLSKAIYYLSRFDNLVSGDDDLYEKFNQQDSQAMQSFIFDTEGQLSVCPISSTVELEEPADMEFAACGILADYYYRASDTELKDVPQIQQETARILSDYDFVKSEPDYETFQERIDGYKTVMLM